MSNWLTKKNVLILSSLGAIATLAAVFLFRNSAGVCGDIQIDALNDSYNACLLFGSLTFIAIPIFVFSTMLFFTKNKEIFIVWRKFTFVYSVLYFITVFCRPSQGDFLDPSQKDTALALSFGYFVITLFFISFKTWESSRAKKGKEFSAWTSSLLGLMSILVGVVVSFLILNI